MLQPLFIDKYICQSYSRYDKNTCQSNELGGITKCLRKY